MLFLAIYRVHHMSEDAQKRSIALFTNWKPPFEFKAHYARSDGNGGVAILEAADPSSVLEGIAPWTPFFEFEISPAVDIQDAVPIFMRANAWRDSVR
jgi:Protein of unknown function (DUF3303)